MTAPTGLATRIPDATRLDVAVTALAATVAEQSRIGQRADALRRVIDAAIRGGVTHADRWTRDQAVVRWDVPKSTVGVADEAAVASWLATRTPDEVEVAVHVHAGDLEAVLDALEFAGLAPIQATATARPAAVGALLKRTQLIRRDVAHDSGTPITETVVVDTATGEVVPGLAEFRGEAKLVAVLDKAVRADHEVAAAYWLDQLLTGREVAAASSNEGGRVTAPPPLTIVPDHPDTTALTRATKAGTTGGAVVNGTWQPLHVLKLDELKRQARQRGLSVFGTKADIVARVHAHDQQASA